LKELSYGKRLHAAARKDFISTWSAHRWWMTLMSIVAACSGVAIQIIYLGSSSVANLEMTLMVGITSLILSMIGSYLISMRRGAAALDVSREEESLKLRQTIELLTPPKRTAAEEYKYAEAERSLVKLGDSAKTVLRFVMKHGVLKFVPNMDPPAPEGMTPREMRAIMDACEKESLISINKTPTPAGADYSYIIAPGMKSVLDDLLYPPK
jgi:hypothetical protein